MLVTMGWTFGVVEAISVTIFVGFSVDYCLHLANGYNESEYLTSYGRTKDALTHIGGSVLSASITTIGASFFLLFCEIVIFQRFGYVIGANIFISIIYALFFFCPILIVAGPTGESGTMRGCYHFFLRVFSRGKAKDAVVEDATSSVSLRTGDEGEGVEMADISLQQKGAKLAVV